jgi:hypothetical protein
MYKVKEVAKRGSALVAAVSLLAGIGASALPAMASADALNPLTERSLTLSSSSPGWAYTDGSGNSTYAPPNSGANGQKTGNYFSFRVSTNSALDANSDGNPDNPIKAMSFQYCVGPAGDCAAPGNDASATPAGSDDATHSDLNVNYPSAAEVNGTTVHNGTGTITVTSGSAGVTGTGTAFTTELKVGGTINTAGGNIYVIKAITDATHLVLTANAAATETGVAFTWTDFLQVIDPSTGLVKAVPGYTDLNPKYVSSGGKGDPAEAAKNVAGNFIVMYKNGATWTQSTGWTVSSSNQEEATTGTTGKKNAIILQNSTGMGLPSGTEVKVLFFATSSNYITNPGQDSFFVKINTFKSFAALGGGTTLATNVASGNVIDGGVTVANVMNESIQIQTKVLETMQFSVGTVDPDTLTKAQLAASANGTNTHQSCDKILTAMLPTDQQDVLSLGNQGQESSLETGHTYATHSYWRLSSNSSAGATVYYSGHTLSNTSGDEIAPIGTVAKASAIGAEQFGLALDTKALSGSTGVANLDSGTYGVDYSTAGTYEHGADDPGGVAPQVDNSVLTDQGADLVTPDYSALNKSYHTPKLDPLVPTDGTNGTTDYGHGSGTITSGGSAKFAFDPMSDTVPAPIATEGSQVVDCVTGKMRYIANIAATTPAGIYTTKVNYIAAPQY